jgi:hypothetical protein
MKRAHQKTLLAIFSTPAPSTMEWRKIEALFEAVGAEMVEGDGSRGALFLERECCYLSPPAPT